MEQNMENNEAINHPEIEKRHKNKDKVWLFIIGFLAGAVVATGAFFAYVKIANLTPASEQSTQMPGGPGNQGGTPPEMPSGENGEMGTPPELPDGENGENQPPEIPEDDGSNQPPEAPNQDNGQSSNKPDRKNRTKNSTDTSNS